MYVAVKGGEKAIVAAHALQEHQTTRAMDGFLKLALNRLPSS
ncbi:Uncharacterised protein [Raoultella terrigena]|uniref:PhnI protein n=1 Tax=Raoultella terrigena TaxID=577 RepID=A0A3P8J842_RAOTE|nr:Uncharacterised protein [Raoultella terrigena]